MKLLNFFKKFYNVYIGIVFLLVIFVTPFIGFQFRRNYASDNIIYFVITCVLLLALVLFLVWTKKRFKKFWNILHNEKSFKKIILWGTLVVFILEIIITSGAWFIAGWDTRDVIFPDKQMNSDYMSMYPNQMFLAGFFRRIYFFATQTLAASFDDYYKLLVLLSTLCVLSAVIMSAFITKKLVNSFVGVIAFVLGAVFLGLSPWIMIPYSDTFAMFCTVCILFSYVCIEKKYIKWPLIVFVSYVGYCIKPTAIFILFAILFYELVCFIVRLWKRKIHFKLFAIKKYLIPAALTVIAFCAAFSLDVYISNYGVENNEDRNFTATHYFMMGVNYENRGAWNDDDVNFTRSYSNVERRQEANLKEFFKRIDVYGLNTICWIYFNKTLTNYSDGSFCWEAETPWCIENKGNNPVVWAFYGIDPADAHDDNNNFSAYIRQMLWFVVLMGCFLLLFNKKNKAGEYVMCFSLLCISAFLMLFEPDPRYMLLYVPYMVILASWGWWLILRNGTKVRLLCEVTYTNLEKLFVKVKQSREKK